MKFVIKQRLITIFAALGIILLCKDIFTYASSAQLGTTGTRSTNMHTTERDGLKLDASLYVNQVQPVAAVTAEVSPLSSMFAQQTESGLTRNGHERGHEPAEKEKRRSLSNNSFHDMMKKMVDLEFLFDSTIRSCLGVKCFDERPLKSAVDRVGLLGTDLSGVDQINDCIFDLLGVKYSDTNDRNILVTGEDMQKQVPRIIQSSHVPAYGYGKNHGWSRIIRVIRRPAYQAVDLLARHGLLHEQKNVGDVSVETLVSAQTRQLVRWQCRLSHVAAHTKMLTVYIEDVIKRPALEIEKIMTFAGVALPERKKFLEVAAKLATKLRETLRLELLAREHDLDGAFALNTNIGYLGMAAHALEEEMTGTNHLSDWPCRSFRKLDSVYLLPHSASYVAPNCSAPFVTCSVGIDKKGA